MGSIGSIEPTDFWSLYVVNPWILWQSISGIEYDYHYLDSSLVLNPWIEIPNATPDIIVSTLMPVRPFGVTMSVHRPFTL